MVAIGWGCAAFSPTGASQEASTNDEAMIQRRVDFLQQNFSKFVPVQFQKGTNSDALIQVLHVRENIFQFEGSSYCGFRFTVPEWIDGDFEWMYLFAKTEANKDFRTSTLQWYIIPERGRAKGFDHFMKGGFARYPSLKAKFPFTSLLTTQDLQKDRLEAGKSYAIWFGFKESNMPDIAFAMTIDSDRGAREIGVLPLR